MASSSTPGALGGLENDDKVYFQLQGWFVQENPTVDDDFVKKNGDHFPIPPVEFDEFWNEAEAKVELRGFDNEDREKVRQDVLDERKGIVEIAGLHFKLDEEAILNCDNDQNAFPIEPISALKNKVHDEWFKARYDKWYKARYDEFKQDKDDKVAPEAGLSGEKNGNIQTEFENKGDQFEKPKQLNKPEEQLVSPKNPSETLIPQEEISIGEKSPSESLDFLSTSVTTESVLALKAPTFVNEANEQKRKEVSLPSQQAPAEVSKEVVNETQTFKKNSTTICINVSLANNSVLQCNLSPDN